MKKLKIPTPKKKEKNLKEESDILVIKNHPWKQIGKTAGWFILGAILGLFFFISFLGIVYQQLYGKVVFPGVYVNRVELLWLMIKLLQFPPKN
jgi:hypothetical protein